MRNKAIKTYLLLLFVIFHLRIQQRFCNVYFEFQVGLRSITKEGREQGKRFGVEQYEMRTFSKDREMLENLVLSLYLLIFSIFTKYFLALT